MTIAPTASERQYSAMPLAELRHAVLAELADRIREIEDPDALAYAAAQTLAEAMQVSRAGYGTIDKEAETIRIERDWNAPGVASIAGTLHFRDYGSYIEDLKAGRTVAIDNADHDPRTAGTAAMLKAISAHSFVNMPVTEQGGFVALLFLNHAEPRHWTDDELLLIREVAERTRAAVARREAEAALRRNEARLRFLDSLATATASAGDADQVMAITTRFVGEHLDVSDCAYADMDADEDMFTIRGDWHAADAPSIVGRYSLATFGSLAVRNLRAGEPLVINDNIKEIGADGSQAFLDIGIRATICMPFVKEGRLTALMAIHDSKPHYWTDDERNLLREVTERSWAHIERVRAEAALRALNETLEQQVADRTAERDRMWRLSGDLFLVIGPRGRIRAANPAILPLLGYEPDEAVGRSFSKFTHPDDRRAVRQVIRAGAQGPIRDFMARLRAHDGSWRHFAWSAAPGEGEAYVIGRDVTAEIAHRQELELAQEALRQAQKMEALGQVTGGVAHDFNNLLTPILGSLDLIGRNAQLSEREHRLVSGAIDSAERARTLVQRLLAFARRQPLRTDAVDLRTLMDGMAELIASTSGPQIKVAIDIPADLPPALADANQLEMAILNLSVNARDAMPQGGRLHVTGAVQQLEPGNRHRAQPGRYLRLCVADTGSGMDDATMARAIEPFFSTKGLGKGTGLGLSMVHGLALQLGGALHIASKPGLGTSVELFLPIADTAPAPAPEPADQGCVQASGSVLLVDDEPAIRAATRELLLDLGYQVIEADGAGAALERLAGQNFDYLVTDHLMPGISGTELARRVRADHPTMRILVVSGYADLDEISPDLPRLPKPFRQDELAAAIAAL